MSKTFRAVCLCRQCDFTTTVTPAGHYFGNLCHCTSCRHGTGCLHYTAEEWPLESMQQIAKENEKTNILTKYPFSSRVDTYFCSNCGSHMFWYAHSKRPWIGPRASVSLGVLQDSEELVKITQHEYVSDTKDGGSAVWMGHLADGTRLPILGGDQDSKELPADWAAHNVLPAQRRETLLADCLCKGVRFEITRDKTGREFIGGPPRKDVPVEEGAGHYIISEKGLFKAINCACNSCRLTSGVDLTHWAFVHKRNIYPLSGDERGASLHETDPGFDTLHFGTLKKFRSSEDVVRYFCGRCGATALYESNSRVALLDVAVGLFNAESGALALDWLDWEHAKYVCYISDAKNRSLVHGCDKGLKRWQKERENLD